MQIWKFPLEVTDVQIVDMPANAINLDVQVQNGKPCLWAMVNPESRRVPVKIRTFCTGHPVDLSPSKYVGTYQIPAQGLVFHVFEV